MCDLTVKLVTARCDLTIWDKPEPVERSFLLENIKGKDALFTMVTEKINKELLDAAGRPEYFSNIRENARTHFPINYIQLQ